MQCSQVVIVDEDAEVARIYGLPVLTQLISNKVKF